MAHHIGLMAVFAAFFYQMRRESRLPGLLWSILSLVCYGLGLYLLGRAGGVMGVAALFVGITVGRVVLEDWQKKRKAKGQG